jgi:hypothetical protein
MACGPGVPEALDVFLPTVTSDVECSLCKGLLLASESRARAFSWLVVSEELVAAAGLVGPVMTEDACTGRRGLASSEGLIPSIRR